jgi:hypothetical protein
LVSDPCDSLSFSHSKEFLSLAVILRRSFFGGACWKIHFPAIVVAVAGKVARDSVHRTPVLSYDNCHTKGTVNIKYLTSYARGETGGDGYISPTIRESTKAPGSSSPVP